MDNKGGRYTLEINGQVFSGRGKASIDQAGISMDNGSNMDATMFSTVKPELISLDLTLDRRDQTTKWDAAMMLKPINVTFAETDAGVTHVMTSARGRASPRWTPPRARSPASRPSAHPRPTISSRPDVAGLQISVETRGLERVAVALHGAGKKIEPGVAAAINQVGKAGKAAMVQALPRQTGLKRGTIVRFLQQTRLAAPATSCSRSKVAAATSASSILVRRKVAVASRPSHGTARRSSRVPSSRAALWVRVVPSPN